MEPAAEHRPAVRTAGDADGEELVRLAVLARREVATRRGGKVYLRRDAPPEPSAQRFRHLLADDEHLVLIGRLGTVPLGYAVASTAPVEGGPLAVVEELFVEPDARGVGLGRLLMDQVLDWAGARGCTGIDAVALPGDRATKNFFEAAGLVARLITVHRAMGRAEEPGPLGDGSDG